MAVFRVRPAEGLGIRDAAGRIAAESSVGTWTTLSVKPSHFDELMAKAYKFIDVGNGSWLVYIAYPPGLFEEGNMPNFVSSVLGNIFGMKAVAELRAEDARFPPGLVRSFPGPGRGIPGVREALRVHGRPVLATVPKPKLGYTPEEYARVAYEILVGGVDLVKDDENVASQRLIRFEKRLEAVMKAVEKAEAETGERKGYLVNVTAPCREMERRIELVAETGNRFIMLDFLTAGWAAAQRARELAGQHGLAIHGHRAFHAAFTRNPRHGVSMFLVAKMARLVGLDHLHVGTPGVGKMDAKAREVLEYARLIRSPYYEPPPGEKRWLPQSWEGLRPVFPVSSGGLHPGTVPIVIERMGVDTILQVGGGVMGHPDGPRAGAKALRDAVEAAVRGEPLEEAAKRSRELRRALEKWGRAIPV